jgi:hypothetical protein
VTGPRTGPPVEPLPPGITLAGWINVGQILDDRDEFG